MTGHFLTRKARHSEDDFCPVLQRMLREAEESPGIAPPRPAYLQVRSLPAPLRPTLHRPTLRDLL